MTSVSPSAIAFALDEETKSHEWQELIGCSAPECAVRQDPAVGIKCQPRLFNDRQYSSYCNLPISQQLNVGARWIRWMNSRNEPHLQG
jgi:hypothetical protein